MDIRGKTALITGAAAGIGRATAVAVASKGAALVVLADVDEPGMTETAQLVQAAGSQVLVVPTDVADIESQRALFARVGAEAGGLDILHNNAGLCTSMPQFPEISLERIAALADVNLKGVMLGTRLGIDLMARRGGGAIVNTASIAAHAPNFGEAVYGTTKAGVVFFTKSCEGLKQTHNIRVNCVCPGMTDTPMIPKTGADGKPAPWLQPALEMIVMVRPEEIAAVVVDFVEDESRNAEVVTVENRLVGSPT